MSTKRATIKRKSGPARAVPSTKTKQIKISILDINEKSNFNICELYSRSPIIHAFLKLMDLEPDESTCLTAEDIVGIRKAKDIPNKSDWRKIPIRWDKHLKTYTIFSCLHVSTADRNTNRENMKSGTVDYEMIPEMDKKKYNYACHLFIQLYSDMMEEVPFDVVKGEPPRRNVAPSNDEQASNFDQYISESRHEISPSYKQIV